MQKSRLHTVALAVAASLLSAAPVSLAGAPVFTEQQICKAAVGAIMGRDPKTMKVTKSEAGIVYLYYVRPDDSSKWAYRCKLEGSKIFWASETGRWRTDPADETITYKVNGSTLDIVQAFTDGSASTESYKASELGK